MTRYQDHGHEHCDKHCVRIGHGWGQCEGRGGERWHLKCPRCDEREQIVAAIAAAAPREDPLHRDAIREAAEDAYLTCWTIARGEA